MSRSKETFGGHYAMGGQGRRAFRNVRRGERCPVCNADSWCSVYCEGRLVVCRRVFEGGSERVDSAGVPYAVHQFDSPVGPRWVEAPPSLIPVRLSDEALDAAYRRLLAYTELSALHRSSLRARGLSEIDIEQGLFRTLPRQGRAAIAKKVVDDIGDEAAKRLPGLYVKAPEGPQGRWWWTLGGHAGMVVPCMDFDRRIVALKVRADDPHVPRYTYLSSSSHCGPTAQQVVHVPPGERHLEWVRVTEGELKAHVCTALSGVFTVGVPGVGAWRMALPVLARLGATRVRLAFDADFEEKPAVGRALRELGRGLRAAGYSVGVEVWDPALGKGLDDVLVREARKREAA